MSNLLIVERMKGYCDLISAGYTQEVLDMIQYYYNDRNVDIMNIASDRIYKNPGQICEIAQGIIDGLTPEQVRTYASPKNPTLQMRIMRRELEESLNLKEVYK